jgi:hypothetical protein
MARQPEEWARGLVNRMSNVVGEAELDCWAFQLGSSDSPALQEAYDAGHSLSLGLLLTDPRQRDQRLAAICLMITRRGESHLLPDKEWLLQPGDRILLCGRGDAYRELLWTLDNRNVLDRLLGDDSHSGGSLARWLKRRLAAR